MNENTQLCVKPYIIFAWTQNAIINKKLAPGSHLGFVIFKSMSLFHNNDII